MVYGTRAEDTSKRKIAPGLLRAPLKSLAPAHRSSWSRPGRTVNVIRHSIRWLRRLMHRGLAVALTVAGTQARLERYPPRSHLKHNTYPCHFLWGSKGRRVPSQNTPPHPRSQRHDATHVSRPPTPSTPAPAHTSQLHAYHYQEPYRLGEQERHEPLGGG